jgi:hypothetical protein
MVGALKTPGVAALLTAYERAAMCTGVEENADHAIVAPNKYQRSAGDPSRAEIAPLRDFRFVPGINPTFSENPLAFALEIFGLGECTPINPENPCFLIIDNQVIKRRLFHVCSPPQPGFQLAKDEIFGRLSHTPAGIDDCPGGAPGL